MEDNGCHPFKIQNSIYTAEQNRHVLNDVQYVQM